MKIRLKTRISGFSVKNRISFGFAGSSPRGSSKIIPLSPPLFLESLVYE
jgi:hypothetical protein